jgi:hypothetical protein
LSEMKFRLISEVRYRYIRFQIILN